MNLSLHYQQLYADSRQKILTDCYVTDELIDSPDDAIRQSIQQVMDELMAVESMQYYHPASNVV